MTVPDVLDSGFGILRRAPATVLGVTATFAVPVSLLVAWGASGVEGVDADSVLERTDSTLQVGGPPLSDGAAVLAFVAPSLALVFVAAALARLASAWAVGHDLELGTVLRATVRRTWPLLAAWTLVHLLELVSSIGIVAPLAVMALFVVTAPAIGAEDLGPVAALRRSARLTRRAFWRVLGIALLSIVVEEMFVTAVAILPTLVSAWLGTDGIGWVLSVAVNLLTTMVTLPIVAGITVSLYLDLRVRTEGLDLELAAIEAFPRPLS